MINEEALKMAIKAIEAEPQSWNQQHRFKQVGRAQEEPLLREFKGIQLLDTMSCNTTMCLAGQVVHQAGWLPIAYRDYTSEAVNGATYAINPETGAVRPVDELAKEILGFSQTQANVLFGAHQPEGGVEEFKATITEFTGVTFE